MLTNSPRSAVAMVVAVCEIVILLRGHAAGEKCANRQHGSATTEAKTTTVVALVPEVGVLFEAAAVAAAAPGLAEEAFVFACWIA